MAVSLSDIHIRTIQPEDNKAVASLIRNTLTEFGLNKPGTVYTDPTTDALFELFERPRSVYYVALHQDAIIGGGGIYPSQGLPSDTCELVKMYVLKDFRGIGLGRSLIQKCIQFATETGYHFIYLESMPELKKALETYAHFGFKYLDAPMGDTGHFGCDLWMLKEVSPLSPGGGT